MSQACMELHHWLIENDDFVVVMAYMAWSPEPGARSPQLTAQSRVCTND